MTTTHTATISPFPALAGETVTEAHVQTCRERGHAARTVDGTDSGACPRCGEVTTDAVAKFDRVLDLEAAVRLTRTARAFNGAGVPNFRKAQQDQGIAGDAARLSAAIDALTPAELAAFGEYRKAAR
jgi:sigma54-dependent transcription regulator